MPLESREDESVIISGTVFLSHQHTQNRGSRNRFNIQKSTNTNSTNTKNENSAYIENPLNLSGISGKIYTVHLSSNYGQLLLIKPSDRIIVTAGKLHLYTGDVMFLGERYHIDKRFISFHLIAIFDIISCLLSELERFEIGA